MLLIIPMTSRYNKTQGIRRKSLNGFDEKRHIRSKSDVLFSMLAYPYVKQPPKVIAAPV